MSLHNILQLSLPPSTVLFDPTIEPSVASVVTTQPKRVSIGGIDEICLSTSHSVSPTPISANNLHSCGILSSVANPLIGRYPQASKVPMIFPQAVGGNIQQNGSKTESIHYGIIPNYAGTASAVYGLPNFHSLLSSSFFRLQQLRRAETTFTRSNSARNDAVLGLLCLGDAPRAKSEKAVKFTDRIHETVLPSRNKVQADAIEGFGALKRPFPQKPDLSTSQTLSVSRRPKALSTPCDPGNVNGLHRFVRSELLELFEPSQATGSKQLRNSRVGLRCVYCAQAHRKGKNVATTYSFFPKSLEDIYIGVCTWQRLHFARCNNVPKTKSEKYLRLKEDRRRGKKAYWADSAHEIGLRNVSHKREGIMWCQEISKDT